MCHIDINIVIQRERKYNPFFIYNMKCVKLTGVCEGTAGGS